MSYWEICPLCCSDTLPDVADWYRAEKHGILSRIGETNAPVSLVHEIIYMDEPWFCGRIA